MPVGSSAGNDATPAEHDTPAPCTERLDSEARQRSAIAYASSADVSGSTSTNSSPPTRPTIWRPVTCSESTLAIACSAASPSVCP